jgi:hypothetical protein
MHAYKYTQLSALTDLAFNISLDIRGIKHVGSNVFTKSYDAVNLHFIPSKKLSEHSHEVYIIFFSYNLFVVI